MSPKTWIYFLELHPFRGQPRITPWVCLLLFPWLSASLSVQFFLLPSARLLNKELHEASAPDFENHLQTSTFVITKQGKFHLRTVQIEKTRFARSKGRSCLPKKRISGSFGRRSLEVRKLANASRDANGNRYPQEHRLPRKWLIQEANNSRLKRLRNSPFAEELGNSKICSRDVHGRGKQRDPLVKE